MSKMTLTELQDHLKSYLSSHEDDIFNGINDFGDLRALFLILFGRPAKADISDTCDKCRL